MKKYPLNKAFTFIEPGPVVLITTSNSKKNNILTLSWTMVLDFTPRFAFMTGSWNYSYKALIKNNECVIAIPTGGLLKKVVSIGSCSGSNEEIKDKRLIHAIGDGRFYIDGVIKNHRKLMKDKLPKGV